MMLCNLKRLFFVFLFLGCSLSHANVRKDWLVTFQIKSVFLDVKISANQSNQDVFNYLDGYARGEQAPKALLAKLIWKSAKELPTIDSNEIHFLKKIANEQYCLRDLEPETLAHIENIEYLCAKEARILRIKSCETDGQCKNLSGLFYGRAPSSI